MNNQRNYYQDYTASGIKNFEETDIYQNAISIGDRSVVEDPRPNYPNYQRRVVRNVEVPFNRQVRVPTVETKLVPAKSTMKVPVKRMVEVPSYRIMDEEYTDWEPQEKVREKEIWVKQVVHETYMENVPIKRVRQVRVPHKELQEVEELQDVEVSTTKAVKVPGYRVDEVQDSKVVEVEELEDMRWEAEPTGDHQLSKTTEGPIIPGSGYSRKPTGGNEYYSQDDHEQNYRGGHQTQQRPSRAQRPASAGPVRSSPAAQPKHSHVDLSNHPHNRWRGQETLQYTRPSSASFYRKQDLMDTQRQQPQVPARVLNPSQPMRPLEEPYTSNAAYGWQTSTQAANGWFTEQTPTEDARFGGAKPFMGDGARNIQQQRFGGEKSKGLGITVKSTASLHTESYGVAITKVLPASGAARAGLRVNDIIIKCQNQGTTSVEELGNAIKSASGGQLRMLINRDGNRGTEIIVSQ